MITITEEEMRNRLKQAQDTLRNVKKSKSLRWNISKENMITYCNETIILCKIIIDTYYEKE